MADIPKYADFAKSYTDLVSSDDFPATSFNLKINAQTANKVKVTVNASQGTAADSQVTGDIKAKATVRDVTFTETLALPKDKSGAATLRFQTEFKNLFTKGVKAETDVKFPISDAPAFSFETTLGFANPSVNVQAKLAPRTKVAEVSGVFGAKNVTAGASATVKLDSTTLSKASVAASYSHVDFDITGQLTIAGEEKTIDAYFAQDVFKNRSLLLGVKATHKLKAKTTGLELATSYRLDSASTVRAKVQSDGAVGLSLAHLVREDIKVTLGANTDTKLSKTSLGFTVAFGN